MTTNGRNRRSARLGGRPPARLAGEVRALGVGSALALAFNDAVSRKSIAPIHRQDLAWESVILAGWVAGLALELRDSPAPARPGSTATRLLPVTSREAGVL